MAKPRKYVYSQSRELISATICLVVGLGFPIALAFFFSPSRVLPRLFSFSEGVWHPIPAPPENHVFPQIKSDVDIAFDASGIPHVIAQNQTDSYFAQGVLAATFRLFEMDISTRAGMGRLSELLGDRTASLDRFFVTFGMREAIEEQAKALLTDPVTKDMVESYVAGVNAVIEDLNYKNLPLEYKFMGTWPEPWTASRVAALMKVLTFRLAGRSNDLRLTEVLKRLGEEKTNQLYPEFLPIGLEDYFSESPQNTSAGSSARKRTDHSWKLGFKTEIKEFPAFLQPLEVNGSNSWAIGPERSKTGASILANDTHLSIQLPAIWFETQLITPEMNVYGATFPGAPGIVLGFNESLAWGTTNGATDVLDWYEVDFKDEKSLEYKIGDHYKTAKTRDERILVRGQDPISITVLKTDFGVVVSRENKLGLSARWTGFAPSEELKVIGQLDTAKSVKDCVEALSKWRAPIQNFTCADEKNISIYHAGDVPLRNSGAGRVVEKATEANLWRGVIPYADLPHEINPARGYVLSANERPANLSYPYYLGWDFEEPFRAKRIHTHLADNQKMDGSDFIQMQNDALNQHALMALPLMLRNLRFGAFNETEKQIFEAMRQWDFLERGKSMEPSVFDRWWKKLETLLWDEVTFADHPLFPKKARTIWFFRQIESDPDTYADWLKPFKSMDEVVTTAFREALVDLAKEFGPDPASWTWSTVQETQALHVAKFPGLSSPKIAMDGGAHSINGNRGHHGAAWKLVVEMGPHLRAWSQFPGGVTGNPLDPDYEKFLEAWSRGEMRPVYFWKTAGEAERESMYVWKWRRQ
jgi:penicillin G amidase